MELRIYILQTSEASRKCSDSSAYVEGAVICIIFLETLVSSCMRGDDTASLNSKQPCLFLVRD
jgi:hypothetical protein